jgi:hypothetical protein
MVFMGMGIEKLILMEGNFNEGEGKAEVREGLKVQFHLQEILVDWRRFLDGKTRLN